MTKKLTFILALVLVLSLVLTACERSASQNVLPTPTFGGESALEEPDAGTVEPGNVMAELETFATQTAMAADALLPATATPTPVTDTGALPSPTATLSELPAITTPGTTLATPVVTRPATYTLMKGEYPFCIARRFNVNQYELLNLNGLTLSEGSNLPVGYTLQIPQTGNPFVGTRALIPHPTTHTVLSDETVYKIACRYGDVTPEAIIAFNNLVAPYTLTVGQQLSIP